MKIYTILFILVQLLYYHIIEHLNLYKKYIKFGEFNNCC